MAKNIYSEELDKFYRKLKKQGYGKGAGSELLYQPEEGYLRYWDMGGKFTIEALKTGNQVRLDFYGEPEVTLDEFASEKDYKEFLDGLNISFSSYEELEDFFREMYNPDF